MRRYLNNRQPLWMPEGSIRAVLALAIILPITVIMLRSGISFTGDQVIGLASLILSAYFIQKAATGNKSAE